MSCAHEVAGRVQTRERSREACKTNGIDAYGEVVWSWHPLLMPSRAEVSDPTGRQVAIQSARRRWQKGTRHRGEREVDRKTIAWGMPDDSGASAVNTGAHTKTTQRAPGCECIGHPAFPAPSV